MADSNVGTVKRQLVSPAEQVKALHVRAQRVKNKQDVATLNAALNVFPEMGSHALEHVLTLTRHTPVKILRLDQALRDKKKKENSTSA
jgi:hypothetical protein